MSTSLRCLIEAIGGIKVFQPRVPDPKFFGLGLDLLSAGGWFWLLCSAEVSVWFLLAYCCWSPCLSGFFSIPLSLARGEVYIGCN
jgi:hypothetical protein